MPSKSAASPKIRASTVTRPLNSRNLSSGRWAWTQGQEQAGTPLPSDCSTANCRFHSWVELSKRYPSTLSSELLSWCSLSPTIPPSKTVYRWKDAATAHTFLQTSQFEIEAFLRFLCENHHMPTVITTRAKAFYGRGGGLLAWMSSVAILLQFIFAPLTRNMGPLKFFINRVYLQTVRSGRNLLNCYLIPIWHHPTDVHACIHPFKTTERAEVSGKSWSRACREWIIWSTARLEFSAHHHKSTRNGIWPG